jgi:hypothetical protein
MTEDPVMLARQTLEEICRDKRASAVARARAARTLLEIGGLLRGPRTRPARTEAAEMSIGELDARLEELERERSAPNAGPPAN